MTVVCKIRNCHRISHHLKRRTRRCTTTSKRRPITIPNWTSWWKWKPKTKDGLRTFTNNRTCSASGSGWATKTRFSLNRSMLTSFTLERPSRSTSLKSTSWTSASCTYSWPTLTKRGRSREWAATLEIFGTRIPSFFSQLVTSAPPGNREMWSSSQSNQFTSNVTTTACTILRSITPLKAC